MSIVASSSRFSTTSPPKKTTFKDEDGNVRYRIRRPSRSRETEPDVILRAIHTGMHRPKHTDDWLVSLQSHPEYDSLRADLKTALLKCATLLTKVADFTSMTTRPTWDFLAHALGVTRRSVARYLRHLRDLQLLGIVASGRTAEWASVGPDGERINEAAVYVMCQPNDKKDMEIALQPFTSQPVDGNVTPPSFAGQNLSFKKVNPHTRARESARGSKSKEQRKLGCSVEQIRWNQNWIAQTKAQRRSAAWRLRSLIPHVFGAMSVRDLAATLKDFFAAEWTVKDIHHALDVQPDGTPWPHSGAPDTKSPRRLRGWLKYRLAAWRDPQGNPIKSNSQQAQERRKVREQNRQIEAERKAQRKAQVQACPPEVKKATLADIRKMFSRRKATL